MKGSLEVEMRKHSKWIVATWVLLISIVALLSNPNFANQNKIVVEIDYVVQDFGGLDPLVVNNRTLVPMRQIFETLGCKVIWDNPTQSITSSTNDAVIKMRIGSKKMTVNGKEIQLDVAPMIHKSRTMVPLRAVSEALGAEVVWHQAEQMVAIYYSMPRVIKASEPMSAQNKQFSRLMTFNSRRMAFQNDMNFYFVGTIVGDELIIDGAYEYDEYSMFNFGLRVLDEWGNYMYLKDANGFDLYQWAELNPNKTIPTQRIKLTEKNKPMFLGIYAYTKENHPVHPGQVVPHLSHRVIIEWDAKEGGFVFRKPLKLESLQRFFDKVIIGQLQRPEQHLNQFGITPEIKALSDRITAGAQTGYDKLRLIDKWLRDNIYYDQDNLNNPNTTYNYAMPREVAEYKRATCWGHCITFTDLARAQGIPTTKVIGYISHDINSGVFDKPLLHSWNISFVDGRWIIVDSTWNNASITENGQWNFQIGNALYFDASPVYMSTSHDFRYIMESHDWYNDGASQYEEY